MDERSFRNALGDLAQHENRVGIVATDGRITCKGRIHEVFDDYLVLRQGIMKDRDVLIPLGNIVRVYINKLAE